MITVYDRRNVKLQIEHGHKKAIVTINGDTATVRDIQQRLETVEHSCTFPSKVKAVMVLRNILKKNGIEYTLVQYKHIVEAMMAGDDKTYTG